MKKLQQKCFLASAGFHSLLIVILVKVQPFGD